MPQKPIDLFKAFIKKHPGLIDEVKNGAWTWKELYEEWYLLGDDDEKWIPYAKDAAQDEKTDGFAALFSKLKNVNLEDVHKNIVEMRGLVSSIQEFVRELQPNKPSRPPLYDFQPNQSFPSHYQQMYAENRKF